MARNSFGNTGSSSLLRTATAALNRTNTYNDAEAAFTYDQSAKTQADYKTYKAYLDKRVAQTQSIDPTKALSLTRTAVSANRSYVSSEINRATTNVEFGNQSNRDKYTQIANLYQAAQQNGDDNLAQNLYNRMAGLSITIQNEDKANADAATAAGNKAAAAQNKAYTQALSQREDLVKQLDAAKLAGQITPAEYNNQRSQLFMGNAKTGQPGIIAIAQAAKSATGDPNGTYQSKLDGYAADRSIQKYVNGNSDTQNALGNRFGQVIVKNQDGTYGFQDRPSSEITSTQVVKDANGKPIKDSYGHVVTTNTYASPQASTDSKGKVTGFQYATNIDANGNVAPGTGPGAIRQVGKGEIRYDDPSGVPYFVNEAGQKKYIGKDSANGRAIMGNTPDVVTGKVDTSSDGLANPVNYWSSLIGQTSRDQNNKTMLGSVLNGLFARNDQAQTSIAQKALEARVAAQNQAKDAATLAASRQVLPAYRPAPPPPAPPPKITAKPSQYNLPALPAPVPLGKTGISVPSGTGNYQKDVLNLGRSLAGTF